MCVSKDDNSPEDIQRFIDFVGTLGEGSLKEFLEMCAGGLKDPDTNGFCFHPPEPPPEVQQALGEIIKRITGGEINLDDMNVEFIRMDNPEGDEPEGPPPGIYPVN